ncbi:MAG: hypothetical protein ACK5KO_08035 [Arachnia sp.]
MRRSRFAQRLLIATMATLSLLAVGCTAGDWDASVPPGAGVQADSGPVKVRNLLVISDEDGNAVVSGVITASEAVTLQGVVLAATKVDGTAGEGVAVDFSAPIARGKAIALAGPEVAFVDPELTPGLLAHVTLGFDDGTRVLLEAPVVSAEHDDYAQAWADAQA